MIWLMAPRFVPPPRLTTMAAFPSSPEARPLKLSRISLLLAATLLTACTNSNVQPQPEPSTAEQAVEQAAAEAARQAAPAQSSASPAVTSEDFERLESRFNLAQEQLLGLITQSAQTQALNQRILLQLQGIQNTLGSENVDGGAGGDTMGGYDTAALDAVLEQLLLVANDIGGSSGTPTTPFGMAMTYIGGGNWKVIRFNRTTGETWLARGNDWLLLSDSEILPEASYEVRMISGEDLLVPDESIHKGFVAARLDRTSGRIWWLNKTTWQAFGE